MITVEKYQRLYASIPARIAVVLEAKGGWTNF
jgi:hypothetical protein